MDDQLLFANRPDIRIGSNSFSNVRIPIQYNDQPMLEFLQAVNGIVAHIPILDPDDGVKVTVVKEGRIFLTEDGRKRGYSIEHHPNMQVCKKDQTILYEIRRDKAAAICTTAELRAVDGCFLKWNSDNIEGFRAGHQFIEQRVIGCGFVNCDIGILIGETTQKLGVGIRIALG